MLKKALITLFAIMALSSLGGVFLAGLNIYTRSTSPPPSLESKKTASVVTNISATNLAKNS